MTLTGAGERYLRKGRKILDSIESLEADVGLDSDSPRGVLKVSASVAFGRYHIVPTTFDFMKIYPDVRIDLMLTDAISDIAREGIDVAVRSAALTDSSLVARKLASNDRIICAAPAYLETNGALNLVYTNFIRHFLKNPDAGLQLFLINILNQLGVKAINQRRDLFQFCFAEFREHDRPDALIAVTYLTFDQSGGDE
ncbi:hypothetical protein C5748_10260 [Phyllobacterium phragmitis]|uniref:LysR substrate-binding domain-containing protein n=1 Tax=Phyllobacterium phragmitis TaxID=2670329 RepID=A0A2S9ISY4_9HYPH|nr:LysR substrate-binding domain-containing protein [Phyllobacterium phragmitis]PRD43628.1 hypothetical protein C5748_10260 [Phyllobacterium phragmitis]